MRSLLTCRVNRQYPMIQQSIPVLDLQCFTSGSLVSQKSFVTALGTALEDIGFFALVNHGVDSSLIKTAYQTAQQFFELPEAVKRQYENVTDGQRGFTRFGKEHAKGCTAPDLKEFWHLGRELPAQHRLASLYQVNQFPVEVPEFQPVMVELYRQLEICADKLLEACALYLGAPKTLLRDMTHKGNTLLRIIHYPPVATDTDPASIRAAQHEDINFITLLCEATAEGLELLQRDGTWLPIHALPGQIIVDTGDMLQQLTNGLLRSTTHRVTNPTSDRKRRFSMPFFVHPRSEIDLTPLPSCVTKTGGKQKFPTITAGEYLAQRLREIGLAS